MDRQIRTTKIDFLAIGWNRLIAALLLMTISIIYARIFSLAFLSEEILGNWLFLGGPSLWWATNFLNTFAIIYLLVFCVFTTKRITIDLNEQVKISEKYIWRNQFTEISEDVIKSIETSTTRIRGKYIWIFFFGIQIWYLTVDGLAWLGNPFVFGFGTTTGWVYVIQAGIDLIALFLILGIPPIEVKYYTNDFLYTLLIPGMNPKKYKIFSRLMQMNKSIQSAQFKIQINRILRRKSYILLGIVVLSIAIIGKALKLWISDPLSISLSISGFIWLNYGWNYLLPTTIRFPKILLVAGLEDKVLLRDPNERIMIIWNILIIINLIFWIGFGIYSSVMLLT